MKGIWISWEKHRRNVGISKNLGFKLFEIVYSGFRLKRYLLSALKTISLIYKEKPDIVIAQNPSIVLSILVLFLKNIKGFKAVIDAHNSGIFPLEGKAGILNFMSRLIQKYSDITIVTNPGLKDIVEANGGRAFILPDSLPDPPKYLKKLPLKGDFNIVYICSWTNDEPFYEVIKAANLIPKHIHIYFTGDFKKVKLPEIIPENITLLGYVKDEYYWNMLYSCEAIMDLTTRQDCIVCGAYEGLSLFKPMILSNTKAIRDLFRMGCIYVESNASSISKGVIDLAYNKDLLQKEIKKLNLFYRKYWNKKLQHFRKILNNICNAC